MIITNLTQFFRALVCAAAKAAEVTGRVPIPWFAGGMHFCQEWKFLVIWPEFPLLWHSEWGSNPLRCRCGLVCPSPVMTFVDATGAGLDPGDIDDWVDAWHHEEAGSGRPLRELLGMSRVEYSAWVADGRIEPGTCRPRDEDIQ